MRFDDAYRVRHIEGHVAAAQGLVSRHDRLERGLEPRRIEGADVMPMHLDRVGVGLWPAQRLESMPSSTGDNRTTLRPAVPSGPR